ncbi:MAG: SusD/RagB family nutrient-binding outer membrane lipoprotein [Bacteroidetes bacterium]|nr:SusD/RagB family nutrient-binding outer membrane lipoprotein [Bacteroidota bacterium]
MKKFQILFIVVVLIFVSCKKDLENQFKDPNKVNPPTASVISGMFSNMLYQWKLYVQDYGEYWWQNSGWGVPNYAQVTHRYITQRYAANYADYADLSSGNGFDPSGISEYNDFYTRMKDWALLRDNVASLSGTDLKDNQIYLLLATVMKDYYALKIVDMYNSIPYSEAFLGNQGNFFPKYDDPKAIYISVLNDWKDIAGKLTAVKAGMSPAAQNLLKDQDVAFNGDVTKWIQYCNSLRLMYGVKLAGVDPTDAKPHIQDAVANLPTADMTLPFYNGETPNGGGMIVRGMYERTYCNFIPNLIMKRMNYGTSAYEPGIDDPRLPVLSMPTKYNDYRGVSMDADGATAAYVAGDKYYAYGDNLASSLSTNAKSMYNFATFCWNWQNYPAFMMTLAQVDLLEAEAVLKGYATTGKAASDHIKDAVVHSCDMWYGLNAKNASWNPQVALLHPTKVPADIATYSNTVKTKFDAAANVEDKMEILMQQKYIHLNISNEFELWAELRRTHHPLLEPMIMMGVKMKPCPERLRYPSSSLQTNQDNYLKVKDQDNFSTPIFWVPSDKIGKVWYMDNVL